MDKTETIVSDELAMLAAREILGCFDKETLQSLSDFLKDAEDHHEQRADEG